VYHFCAIRCCRDALVSVWESLEDLRTYVYKSAHTEACTFKQPFAPPIGVR
jgi:Domain of unknown function (DUF3291)